MLKIPRGKIAVTPIFDPDISRGGIWLPDTTKERCDQGLVKYVGEGVTGFKPMDYVLFSGYTGTLLNIEGEGRLILMRAKFVMAKIIPNVKIPISGLYFKDRDGEYFPATYESAMEIISQGITESEWMENFDVKSEKPRLEDYDDNEDTWEIGDKDE